MLTSAQSECISSPPALNEATPDGRQTRVGFRRLSLNGDPAWGALDAETRLLIVVPDEEPASPARLFSP